MSRLIGLASAAMLLLVASTPQSNKFLKYKTIEAYEIRPGLLMMPRYSDDGQVCEIGLERRHYFPDKIDLDSALSRKVIDQIADELAPANERGAKTMGYGDIISGSGKTQVTISEYENVSIQIYGDASRTCNEGDIVATIKWKSRKCHADPPSQH